MRFTSGACKMRRRSSSRLPRQVQRPRGLNWRGTGGRTAFLLDFNLPDMDGLEVMLQLAVLDERLPCAIVMLTACGGTELAVNAMKRGAMDYLPKGQVSAEVLAQTVLNAIERFHISRHVEEQKASLESTVQQCQSLLARSRGWSGWRTRTDAVEYANGRWFEYTGRGMEEGGMVGSDLAPRRSGEDP